MDNDSLPRTGHHRTLGLRLEGGCRMGFGDALSAAIAILEGHREEPERLRDIIEALRAEPTEEHPVISSPADVDRLLRRRIAYEDREHFVALFLDTKNRVIDSPLVAVGTNGLCPVHPREVFRPAIAACAASVIVAHNHPSGDTTPSKEDRVVTERLCGAAELVGIELLDHVIVGGPGGYTSLKERGLM